jgi:molybdate transport system substrate-binding protein
MMVDWMIGKPIQLARAASIALVAAALAMTSGNRAMAGQIEVFHADSLGGPMAALKKAFEAKHGGSAVNLTPGTSRQLADRILKGDACDVFAPSSPAIANELIEKKAAAWSVVFSANEMVVITAKGNPKSIHTIADLARPGVVFARIVGEKDLASGRTVEFLKRAATLEGKPEFAQRLVDTAKGENAVPDAVRAVVDGNADASVVYFSAAVAAAKELDIVRFAAGVNLSDAIQNVASVPGTARNPQQATEFVRFILSPEGQVILMAAGQPPIVPAIRKGDVPADVTN